MRWGAPSDASLKSRHPPTDLCFRSPRSNNARIARAARDAGRQVPAVPELRGLPSPEGPGAELWLVLARCGGQCGWHQGDAVHGPHVQGLVVLPPVHARRLHRRLRLQPNVRASPRLAPLGLASTAAHTFDDSAPPWV
eukprot:482835-Prymnesium_polylepis.1